MKNKIIWLTGLPCSGKTTIAKELAKKINAEILDGDDIREFMKNSDFSSEGRKRHMLSVAEIANRFSKYANVIVSLVSPIKEVRNEIMDKYDNVIMIYCYASLKECEKRDVKGMYKKARNKEIENFTGIDAPYEEPNYERGQDHRAYFIDTECGTIEECVNFINEKFFEKPRYSLFIGRWQCLPPHQGHLSLFDKVRKEGKKIMIAIRDTEIDEKNPYNVEERMKSLRETVPDAKIIVIPDIEAVCYGRGVGYDIREIKLGEEIEKISATKIRNEQKENIIKND